MALTDPYTYQFGDSGFILNADVINNGPFVDITKVKGLDSAPFRVTTHTREGLDGGFIDAEFENMRTIILEGTLYAPILMIEPTLDILKENYGPSRIVSPFNFLHPGVDQRTLFCKSLGINCDTDTLRRVGQAPIQFQLQTEDPVIYGPASVISTSIAAAVTGRSYNRSYNYGYGGSAGNGGATFFNQGNRPAGGILRVTNTLNPVIVMSSDTINARLSFTIDISGSNYLEIDLYNRTINMNGTANRRIALNGGSQWFKFPKGLSSIALLGTASGGTPQLTATLRSAYR